jgi:cystathionine gamma-lyase
MKKQSSAGFSTRSIHAGEVPDFREGSSADVVVPIHLSTTFARQVVETPAGEFEYSRSSNPTRKALEEKYAAIEKAKYGLAFASGLAAQSTLLLSVLKSGDHIIASDDLYGGSKRLFDKVLAPFNITASYVDLTLAENIRHHIRPETKMIWMESMTNPLLKICDIAGIAKIANEVGIITVVDNTFTTPYFFNPLTVGVSVSLHSSTKYMAGHSDVVSGALMLSDDELYEKIKFNQNAVGAIASPFDSYLILRGIKTLSARMVMHNLNAMEIAKFLENHSGINRVIYAGLTSHPQHVRSLKLFRGFGGMITFELKGDPSETKRFLERLHVFTIAESLGGVESLVELPAIMTHASLSKEERMQVGITDTMIRMSVGIEDLDDLITDLKSALSQA